MKISTILIITFLLILLISTGCTNVEQEKKQAYQKCTEVCAAVLTDDYVTMHLCNEECKQEFLNST